MKKALLGLCLVLVAAVVGGLWWLNSNAGHLVKTGIEIYGSKMTQAQVSVGAVELKAADGKGTIRNLVIGNPQGFRTPHAFKAAEILIEVDLSTLAKDVVLVKRILILTPDVIYERGDAMTNFDAIQKNIAAYLGPQKREVSPGRKLIVEHLVIEHTQAHASVPFLAGRTVSMTLPGITLLDIGKAKGGVTPGELGQAVADAMKQRLSAAISFDNLMKSAGKALQDAGKAVKELFK